MKADQFLHTSCALPGRFAPRFATATALNGAGAGLLKYLCRLRTGNLALAFAAVASSSASAQESRYVPFPWLTETMITGPACLTPSLNREGVGGTCDQAAHEAWLADVRRWREERKLTAGIRGDRYRNPALAWAQRAYIQPQAMAQDRFLYDPLRQRYTVDRYVDDLLKRYGGIDAVLIWPTYPNLGIDDRNQIDYAQSMPGGVAGIKSMVADFHRRGIRVLFPIMPWDQGTRDPGEPLPQALARFMRDVNADGMNGDTQDGVPATFSIAAEAEGHPLAFQPEGPPADAALDWNIMSWGQYEFGAVPKVDRFRWLEPRHMVNVSDRWARSKTDDLQYAFFNGEGLESWENVWGIWNGITAMDAEAIRRVATIERGTSSFLNSADWEPFYLTRQAGVFASLWPKGQAALWTVVNRNSYAVSGEQFSITATPGSRWFDLYHGMEIKPDYHQGKAHLAFSMEAQSYGAILMLPSEPDESMRQLLATMKALSARPLASFDKRWSPIPQTMITVAPLSATRRLLKG